MHMHIWYKEKNRHNTEIKIFLTINLFLKTDFISYKIFEYVVVTFTKLLLTVLKLILINEFVRDFEVVKRSDDILQQFVSN